MRSWCSYRHSGGTSVFFCFPCPKKVHKPKAVSEPISPQDPEDDGLKSKQDEVSFVGGCCFCLQVLEAHEL